MNAYKTAAFKYVFPKMYPPNFYFECGDGWFKLLWEMSEELNALGVETEATQIKEKYGSLRAYFHCSNLAQEIINRYEEKSAEICENCGKKGEERGGGWIRTLCDDCNGRRK